VLESRPWLTQVNLSRNVPPFTKVPNALEVLERLRDSYKGLSEREALTGADRAVLAAVEIDSEARGQGCLTYSMSALNLFAAVWLRRKSAR
jgi:hypothetical protein